MASSSYEVAIAGLLHDIGKLYQRAHWGEKKPHTQWTHSVVMGLSKLWPRYGIDPEALAHAAAHHHESRPAGWQPQSPEAWAVTLADNYASNEREDAVDAPRVPPPKVPLTPVFDRVHLGQDAPRGKGAYHLAPLTEPATFPQQDPGLAYAALAERLSSRLKSLEEASPIGKEALLSHLNAFLQESTWAVPSDTVGEPDVSLYDHLRLTSAFAAALWNYHSENDGQVGTEHLKREGENKFLLVAGDIGGIQSHIYRIRQSAAGVGGVAKRLRSRSLEVALATETFARHVLNELDLPPTNRILSAGGRFTLLTHHTPGALERLAQLQDLWQRWALQRGGTLVPTLAWIAFSPSELKSKPFGTFLNRLAVQLAETKLQAFAHADGAYLPFAATGQSLRPCPVCDALPSAGLGSDGTWLPCERCQADESIGQRLPKASEIALSNERPAQPYYAFPGHYAVPDGAAAVRFRTRLTFDPADYAFEARPLAGRIPTVGDALGLLETRDYATWLASRGLEQTCDELGTHPDRPLTFEEMALFAGGSPHLGALMLDADRLGEVFARGFEASLQTPSRIGSLSRMLEFFFGFVATDLMQHPEHYRQRLPSGSSASIRERYRLIYSVYAGGDDVFVIGPWDVLLSYARDLEQLYRQYTNDHPGFTLSGGFVLIKPHTPVPLLADRAQAAEKRAKESGRNRLALFGHAVPWSELDLLLQHGQRFFELTSAGELPKGLGHRLLNLWQLFRRWKEDADPTGMKYKPLLFYQKRNPGVNRHWEELFEPLMNQLDPRMQHLPVWVQYALYLGR